MPLHACACEASHDHDALAAQLERLALALALAYSRFADLVNLLNPAMGSYDCNPATVVKAVAIAEQAIRDLPVGEA
jgi:hypothetical protein